MNSLANVNDGLTKRMFTVKLKQKLMAKSPIIVWKLQGFFLYQNMANLLMRMMFNSQGMIIFVEPVDESLLSAARKTITVEKINLYNRLAELFL